MERPRRGCVLLSGRRGESDGAAQEGLRVVVRAERVSTDKQGRKYDMRGDRGVSRRGKTRTCPVEGGW